MIIPKSAIEEVLAMESPDIATHGLHAAGKVINAIGSVGKMHVTIKNSVGKSSITRMGKESILEFPTIFSAAIDNDDAIALTKFFERHYASLLVSIFSLRPSISLNEFENIGEYIKSIHSNDAIPTNYKKMRHIARESCIPENDIPSLPDEEQSEFGVNGVAYEGNVRAEDAVIECWGLQAGVLNTSSINDICQPYKRSERLIKERLNIAQESIFDEDKIKSGLSQIGDYASDINYRAGRVVNVGKNSSPYVAQVTKDSKPTEIKTGAKFGSALKFDTINQAPTMIDVTFYLHGSKSGGGANNSPVNFTQQVTLGVKTMLRQIPAEIIINNLIDGSKSSNPIFKFISWTRGELRLVKDLVFNIGEIKKKFRDQSKDNTGILDMSRNRKEIDDVAKYAGNRVLPYLTMVVTDYEVAQVAQVTGVDLSNERNAKAFMDRYYLLTFAIYETSSRTIKVMYDGSSSFESMSMTYIQTSQKNSMDITKNFGNLVSMR